MLCYTRSWWSLRKAQVPSVQIDSRFAQQQVSILQGSPWCLQNWQEQALSKQHAHFLTRPWRTSSFSLHGSYLTTSSLLESTFTTSCIMAVPAHSSTYGSYLTTCSMALFLHSWSHGSRSSLFLKWLPALSVNPAPEPPVWPHLWLLLIWATLASCLYSLHSPSCHPQSGQEWLRDPGGPPT